MKIIALIVTLVSLLATSCTKENICNTENDKTTVRITGNYTTTFSEHPSRVETIKSIEENDSIIFTSSGGFIALRDTLVYKNNTWEGLKNNIWEPNTENADYCAIHPILKEYNKLHLYNERNELKDVIYCKSSTKHGYDISLQFVHLFANVQINVDDEVNSTIDHINITVSHCVENIHLDTGEQTTSRNPQNILLEKNNTGTYETLVPACENQSVTFEIIMQDGQKHNAAISRNDYQSGYKYICNVKYKNGIYTKEDFIAFSHLINGYEYEGRKLEEFYRIKDGKRVFSLNADLNFTKEDTKLIKGIGPQGNSFDDVFEGNNHTLSGIYYDSDYDMRDRIAIFEYTTENSVIRNLIINQFSAVETQRKFSSTISFLVGYNYGTIDNCHVKNGTFDISQKENDASCLCTVNYGHIANCSIDSLTILGTHAVVGPICISNRGYILNCRVNSDIKTYEKHFSKISITCRANYKAMENVYVYNYSKDYYIIKDINRGSVNNNIFVNNLYVSKKHIYSGEKYSDFNHISHGDTPQDYINNAEQLNQWIEDEGRTKYPYIKFRHWKSDGSHAPVME